MTGAKQIFLMRKLSSKYGVSGRVAARYVAAGYSVTVNPPLKDVDFVASKHGVRFAGIILSGKKLYGVEIVEKAREIGEKYRVKPLLILYGTGPRITVEALEKAREYGVIIRRIR
jgi:protein involved in ribonucleotide reduction